MRKISLQPAFQTNFYYLNLHLRLVIFLKNMRCSNRFRVGRCWRKSGIKFLKLFLRVGDRIYLVDNNKLKSIFRAASCWFPALLLTHACNVPFIMLGLIRYNCSRSVKRIWFFSMFCQLSRKLGQIELRI